jgi:hypothetical protein
VSLVNVDLKDLPIKDAYQDVAQPALREVGLLLENIVKGVHRTIFPVPIWSPAQQQKALALVENSAKQVPVERLVEPPPQILGPVLEASRYEPEGSDVYEMFSALLSNSMDSAVADVVHPAYPKLISQLCRDEAVILKILRKDNSSSSHLEEADFLDLALYGPSTLAKNRTKIREITFPVGQLNISSKFLFYIQHLVSLGLVVVTKDPMDKMTQDKNSLKSWYRHSLSDFGKAFVDSCTRSDELNA